MNFYLLLLIGGSLFAASHNMIFFLLAKNNLFIFEAQLFAWREKLVAKNAWNNALFFFLFMDFMFTIHVVPVNKYFQVPKN